MNEGYKKRDKDKHKYIKPLENYDEKQRVVISSKDTTCQKKHGKSIG